MQLIKKLISLNHNLQSVQTLNADERMLLSDAFIKNDQTLNSLDIENANNILVRARNSNCWLACDCLNVETPPILTVVRHSNGRLSLRKIPRFGEHHHTCDFYRESLAQNPNLTAQHRKSYAIFPKTKFFCEHQSIKIHKIEQAKKIRQRDSREINEKPLPKLGRKLYTLIQAAGLNRLSTQSIPLSLQYQKIMSAAHQFHIDPNHKLSDYLWMRPYQKITACQKLKENIDKWSKGIAPQGYFLLFAHTLDIKTQTIATEFKQKKYEFKLDKLSLSSGRLGKISAPYLAFLTIAERKPHSLWFDAIKGFAVPVYSEHLLMPVESHYERIFLKKLIQVQTAIAKKSIAFDIIKPLFDISAPLENPDVKLSCRPDFLLKTQDKTLCIEVMGSSEPQYLERKKRTHPLMALIGALETFDAHQAQSQNSWAEKLNEFSKRIYRFFLNA